MIAYENLTELRKLAGEAGVKYVNRKDEEQILKELKETGMKILSQEIEAVEVEEVIETPVIKTLDEEEVFADPTTVEAMTERKVELQKELDDLNNKIVEQINTTPVVEKPFHILVKEAQKLDSESLMARKAEEAQILKRAVQRKQENVQVIRNKYIK